MSTTFEIRDGVGVIKTGETLMVTNAEAFRQAFSKWFPRAGCRQVIGDLELLQQIDSAGLGALVAAAKQIRDAGGDLKFCRMQKRPRMVFELTRSHKVFDIFDTLDEALRASK